MKSVRSRHLPAWMIFSFLGLILFSCRPGEIEPDDSHLVDFAKSSAYARRRAIVGYPGSRNEIIVILADRDGKALHLRSPVRVGCRGATVLGKPLPIAGGGKSFSVAPKPDANLAVCAVSVGKRLMPRLVRFEIIEPCAAPDLEVERKRSRRLAKKYSPVFYQDTGRWPRADFFAAVDFDNNLDPIDNRENINAFPLVGAVYYALTETATHAFIIYSVFHPVNYGLFLDTTADSTENDMSGLLVVVDKARPEDPPILVETYMEGQFLQYTSRTDILPGTERIEGSVSFEDRFHPRVFVEAGRHGCLITSDLVLGEYSGEPGQDFSGKTGIVYRFEKNPKEPEGANDRNAGYRLVPILESLWKLRGFVGRRSVFSSTFRMDTGCQYPEKFVSSRSGQRGGRPPWAWDDIDDEGVRMGEWFFWPADVVSRHLSLPPPFARSYTYHPYIGIE